MLISYKLGQGSIILRVKLRNSSVSTGAGLTGLTGSSAGLIISTIADNEASATTYTQAATHIQTIATLGTFVAPSASNCRFGEVDSTNHKGIYEVQIADARFTVASAKSVIVSLSGATNLAECDVTIPLTTVDPYSTIYGITGALPTVTTVTNQLTAAQIVTGIMQDTTASNYTTALSFGKSVMNGVSLGTGLTINDLTTKTGYSLSSTQTFSNTGTWTGNLVGTVSTLTTYTGNTLQTGDSYARIGAAGVGLTAVSLSAAGVQAIWDALTSALTTVGSIGKWIVDKLDVVVGTRMATYVQPTNFLATTFPTTTVASSSEVTAIQNNTRTVIVVPEVIERPDSGTDTYLVHLYLYDETGNMEAPDSAPTVALANSSSTDRSARLGSTTGTLVSTGHYKWVYTNTVSDTLEQLLWEFTVVEGSATRVFGRSSLLVDTTAVDFTAADRVKLTAISDKLPASNIADETLVLAAIPSASTIAVAVRDVSNASPAANSLGAAVNATATNATMASLFSAATVQLNAIQSQTDLLHFTAATYLQVDVVDWKGTTAQAMTGDAFATLGLAGAGLTNLGDARIAAVKAKTDQLVFTANAVNANVLYIHNVVVGGAGTDDNPWGPA